MKSRLGKGLLAALLALILAGALAGIWLWRTPTPATMDWATPVAAPERAGGEIQELLDAYGRALVEKDREGFLATLDPQAAEFYDSQVQMFERLQTVPFSQYQVNLGSLQETGPDAAIAKVATAWTLAGSYPDLPDPERAAFLLAKRDGGWKLSGEASEAALGQQRRARLEDFAPVEALESDHAIVLYHPPNRGVAAEAAAGIDAAWPRLQASLPGTEMPRVIVRVFGGREQIDAAFPGQWQEWTGGGSRPLGDSAGQGGEIIIEANQYQQLDATNSGYNQRMLAHELTHVALFPLGGARTPPFLVEGLSDYVAGEDSAVLLKSRLASDAPLTPNLTDLTRPGSFSVLLSTEAAQLAYEISDTAVIYLVDEYGSKSILELLREFRRRQDETIDQQIIVDESFGAVLGISWDDFEAGWRRYVLENY